MPEPRWVADAALRLRVDDWAAEVVSAMNEQQIRVVLLKGPVVGRWLYPEDLNERPYLDVDLIVSPADTKAARNVLNELGFVSSPHPELEDHALHARPYVREGDNAAVDLHGTLHGLEPVHRALVWEALSVHTETMEVGGLRVEVPAVPVRILHVVLHLRPEDDSESMAWRDLDRAVTRVAFESWEDAAAVARELGVDHELAIRLRRLPDGRLLAERLGLPRSGSPYYRLRAAVDTGRAPSSVLSVLGFMLLPDRRAKLAYLTRKLFPDEEFLREKSALARHGHVGLARLFRVIGVCARLPATLLAWMRHYRR